MLDWIFAIFFLLAFLLMILSIEYRDHPFWGGIFALLDIVLWFILASSVLVIETPAYQYNATLGVMQPTLVEYTSSVAPYLVYFFYMMALIMLVYFVGYFLFTPLYNLVTRKRWR